MKLCTIPNCGKPHSAKGYCQGHYDRFLRYGNPLISRKKIAKKCMVIGCNKLNDSHGYCGMHRMRIKRQGNPNKIVRQHRTSDICSVKDCNKKYYARGYCKKHWYRFDKHGDPSISLKDREGKKKCIVEGCGRKPPISNGYCSMHWHRIKRYGNPNYISNNTSYPSIYELRMMARLYLEGNDHYIPEFCIKQFFPEVEQHFRGDFFCLFDWLIIEVDGENHKTTKFYDKWRDEYLRKHTGLDVKRVFYTKIFKVPFK